MWESGAAAVSHAGSAARSTLIIGGKFGRIERIGKLGPWPMGRLVRHRARRYTTY